MTNSNGRKTAFANSSGKLTKTSSDGKWETFVNFAELMRYVPSGIYFARTKVPGKNGKTVVTRASLDTDVFTTAKDRLRAKITELRTPKKPKAEVGMRAFLERLKAELNPKPDEPICRVKTCDEALTAACKKVGCTRLTHHDLRHLFATFCIEAGIDAPSVSKWLGHSDGGALAMKTYGHLRREHSQLMASRVTVKFGASPEPSIIRQLTEPEPATVTAWKLTPPQTRARAFISAGFFVQC